MALTGENGLRTGVVVAVARAPQHVFSKTCEERIRLVAGLGVEGNAHRGRP